MESIDSTEHRQAKQHRLRRYIKVRDWFSAKSSAYFRGKVFGMTTVAGSNIGNSHVPIDGDVLTYTVPKSVGGYSVNAASSAAATMNVLTAMPPGSSPSGTMSIKLLSTPFPGAGTITSTKRNSVPSVKPTILITYDFPSGIQISPYHANPGTSYQGTTRVAYLPNTAEGWSLLTRFKIAFLHGHMFSIGHSISTGLDNQITWSIIPNKSTLNGGIHGFPDPNYIFQANLYCDHLGIPSADACLLLLQQKQNPPSVGVVSATASSVSTVVYVSGVPVPAPAPRSSIRNVIPNGTIWYTAPKSLSSSTSMEGVLQPLTASCIQDAISSSQECPLCLETLIEDNSKTSTCCMIAACKHRFHTDCVKTTLEHHPKCPVCTLPVGKPQGKCPSGTMMIQLVADMKCPGFDDAAGTYTIIYTILSGIQESYHESPGVPFHGTTRKAFIPNTSDGRDLLRRLIYAWEHGLTFRVGTSLTTGMTNQVTWASIHHKTDLNYNHTQYSNPHSFPDDNYITNCNNSLDALHVPQAKESELKNESVSSRCKKHKRKCTLK